MTVYSKNHRQLKSDIAIHAGEILKDELRSRGTKQKEFAKDIGMAVTQLNEILAGKRPISSELAIILESALGIDASFWNNLQSNYDLETARIDENVQKKAQYVNLWGVIKQYVNTSFLSKNRVLGDDIAENIIKVKEIYNANSIDEIIGSFTDKHFTRFRKSEKLESNKISLITWVKYVQYLAKTKEVATYDFNNKEELLTELKAIFLETNVIENIEKCLSKYGIKFIIQDKPEKVNVDAVAFWSGANPTIALTLRFKRIDNLIFNVLHELGHVFIHFTHKDALIIDFFEDEDIVSIEEREADRFACDVL